MTTEPSAAAAGGFPWAEQLARGAAPLLSSALELPSVFASQAEQLTTEALTAGLNAVTLPDLGDPLTATFDGGGVGDLLGGLSSTAEAAVTAGRRLGVAVADALRMSNLLGEELETLAGGGGQVLAAGVRPGGRGAPSPAGRQDPDAEGPLSVLQAHTNLRRIFGASAGLFPTPEWLINEQLARAIAIGAQASRRSGVIVPSNAAIGRHVHDVLQIGYRFYAGLETARGLLRPEPRLIPSEVVQERRIYRLGQPTIALSQLTGFSRTGQRRVPTSRQQPPFGALRYNALFEGLRSSPTGANLKPDTLDFTRAMIWEIKPAERAHGGAAVPVRHWLQLGPSGHTTSDGQPPADARRLPVC